MENKIEDIKALGKDAIVNIAIDIVKKKYSRIKINVDDYDITASGNTKDIIVYFKRKVVFTPLGKEGKNLHHHITVNIINDLVKPFDWFGTSDFYVPTKGELKKIEFVQNNFNLHSPGFETKVVEKEKEYAIYLDNDVAYGRYFIDKTTGQEIPEYRIESSYLPNPNAPKEEEEEDPLIEIKND